MENSTVICRFRLDLKSDWVKNLIERSMRVALSRKYLETSGGASWPRPDLLTKNY